MSRLLTVFAVLLTIIGCGDIDVSDFELEDPTLEFLPLDDDIALDKPLPNAPKGLGDYYFPDSEGEWHKIQYVDKDDTTIDMRGLGQHLQY